jgi:hypothetical protein
MAGRSSIKALPPEIKQEVDRLLAEGTATIDDIVAALRGMGAKVSRSALGRYSMKFETVASKMREARELASTWAQQLGSIPDNDMGRALVEMLHHMIFKMMLERSEEDGPAGDPLDLMRLAQALKNAALTNSLSVDLELKIRTETEKQTKTAAVKVVENAGRERGLSAETIGAIKASILGVKVAS